jgi:two-component system LytT family response regulator
MQRVAARIAGHKAEDLTPKNTAMLADIRAGARMPERIPIKNSGKISFVNLSDVDWIGSADNYSELHVGNHSHLIRETLTSLSERLPEDVFCRVSRTSIINVTRLKELQPLPHGEYVLTLTTGAKIILSRTYRDELPRLKKG